jgi:polygalacturonase
MPYRKTVFAAAALWLVAGALASAETCDVRKLGAAGDKRANDTAAIQAAIDACGKAGGGTVCFPAGDYLSGTLHLRSKVALSLEPGATIWSSREAGDYEPTARYLLLAEDAENLSIVGSGTIRGLGEADLGRRPGSHAKEVQPAFRVGVLRFSDCKNITIRGVQILYSDFWTVQLRQCENVVIDGVTIRNNYFHVNSDGIDPVSCKHVHISNCHIVSGDDCIVLKSTAAQPCEDVVVTNCTLESIATALKLGTESPGDFRNVHFANCSIRNTRVGLGLFLKDGGTMERITFSDIDIETCPAAADSTLPKSAVPIYIDIEQRNADSRVGRVRDVAFNNIQIQSGAGILLQGMPESPLENLSLTNITFRVCGPIDYSGRSKQIGGTRTTHDERDTLYARKPTYCALAHVRGLTVDNFRVLMADDDFAKYERSALDGTDLENCVIRNVFRQPAGAAAGAPVLSLRNCRNALVSDCIAAPGTPCVVALSGEKTNHIAIDAAGMRAAAQIVTADKDVPEGALKKP